MKENRRIHLSISTNGNLRNEIEELKARHENRYGIPFNLSRFCEYLLNTGMSEIRYKLIQDEDLERNTIAEHAKKAV